MKKLIVASLIVSLLAISYAAHAASFAQTYVLLPNGRTNTIPGPILLRGVVLSGNTTNTSLLFIDSPTNTLFFTNGAFTTLSQYATNAPVSWTNFFGAVNTVTNFQLVTVTNTLSGATNNYNIPFQLSTLASTTTTMDDGQYRYNNGLLITSNSTGTATVTVQYDR